MESDCHVKPDILGNDEDGVEGAGICRCLALTVLVLVEAWVAEAEGGGEVPVGGAGGAEVKVDAGRAGGAGVVATHYN